MLATYLSLVVFVLLAAASPIERRGSSLAKRTIPQIYASNAVTVNGQVPQPGEVYPGIFIEQLPQYPICDASCLDDRQQPPQATCAKPYCKKTIAGVITPTAIYVLRDGVTSFFGSELFSCGQNTCVFKGPWRGQLDIGA